MWASLSPLAADLVLVIGALSLLIVDLVLPHGEKKVLGYGTAGVFIAGLLATFLLDLSGEALGGAYVGDGMALLVKRIVYAGGFIAVLGSLDYGERHWPLRQGEYYQLMLYSVLGMGLLGGVEDLILLAVAFELMGVPLYVMAAFARKDKLAVEGALKLYLTGAVSSAATLYGFSLIFGAAQSTRLQDIAVAASSAPSPILWLGASAALAGMGFKLGVVPFHMWVPDTYRGTSPPFVAFLAVGPKVAGIAAVARLFLHGETALLDGVAPFALLLVWSTIIVGNWMAVPQTSARRLLAYSGVGHMGLVLLGVVAGTHTALAAVMFYGAGYLVTTAGAFLVVSALTDEQGSDELDRFAGLAQKSPFLAFAMLVFLLSLGGIPFVVGFWAKLYLFLGAWGAGFAWSVVLGAMASVVGLFYYLRVARTMYMDEPDAQGISVDMGTQFAIVLCLVFVVGMGVVPQPFVAIAEEAASALLRP
ncbi:MAG: NADH-quinone oxidoreductase subunit N [Deltaproteobacteria bacterium]|nr:MAG: NADH-quinone oxidoreductase subunit N [Deltaproteobacteria bacterium]